ncbi:MAG: hypothetical protein EOO65_04370 [Methanosarcinales archaeon]|nr:MAG: hypothetical protein EOO65_04370 [Methanosarcinales archaeon]
MGRNEPIADPRVHANPLLELADSSLAFSKGAARVPKPPPKPTRLVMKPVQASRHNPYATAAAVAAAGGVRSPATVFVAGAEGGVLRPSPLAINPLASPGLATVASTFSTSASPLTDSHSPLQRRKSVRLTGGLPPDMELDALADDEADDSKSSAVTVAVPAQVPTSGGVGASMLSGNP